MSAAPPGADLPMIVPSLEPKPEPPSWAVCRECDATEPIVLRVLVEGWWECPRCRKCTHEVRLQSQERRVTVDAEIAECYAEDLRRGERGGGGSRTKRYGQKKVAYEPGSSSDEPSGPSGRGDYVPPKTRSVKVPEDVAIQVVELARAIQVPATKLWGVALQRGLEVLRQAKFCLACGGALEEAPVVPVRGCCCG